MRLLLTTILMLLPLHCVFAATEGWQSLAFKQDKPNELAYAVAIVDACPVNEQKAVSIVEGVMVRSRIKPLGDFAWVESNLFLNVLVSCMKLESNNPIYSIEVRFGNFSGIAPILYDKSWGSTGIGDSGFLESAIKGKVEAAITAYLKANFDLGD